jgi:hypothetical protein
MFSGDVQFSVSRDLGGLGPVDGPPIEIHWHRIWNWMPLLPWVLLAALAMLRPNRGRAAWVLVFAAIMLVLNLPPISGNDTVSENAAAVLALLSLPIRDISAVYLTFTTLLLLSYRLIGKSGFRQAASVITIAFAAEAVFMFCGLGMSFDRGALGAMVVTRATPLVAAVIAGFMCRKNFTRRRYNAWFGRGLFITVVVGAGILLATGTVAVGFPPSYWPRLLFFMAIFAVFMPVWLYLLMLPLLLMLFFNTEYRRRLNGIFGVQSEPQAPLPEVSAQDGQKEGESAE